jgi:hypothetical protein
MNLSDPNFQLELAANIAVAGSILLAGRNNSAHLVAGHRRLRLVCCRVRTIASVCGHGAAVLLHRHQRAGLVAVAAW